VSADVCGGGSSCGAYDCHMSVEPDTVFSVRDAGKETILTVALILDVDDLTSLWSKTCSRRSPVLKPVLGRGRAQGSHRQRRASRPGVAASRDRTPSAIAVFAVLGMNDRVQRFPARRAFGGQANAFRHSRVDPAGPRHECLVWPVALAAWLDIGSWLRQGWSSTVAVLWGISPRSNLEAIANLAAWSWRSRGCCQPVRCAGATAGAS
jgi:hypothetical protein